MYKQPFPEGERLEIFHYPKIRNFPKTILFGYYADIVKMIPPEFLQNFRITSGPSA
jgi:hypothetical protein